MPTVATSVAVATPSTTAPRMTRGSDKAGTAMRNSLKISFLLAFFKTAGALALDLKYTTTASAAASTSAGMMPPVKSDEIDTPTTEPMVISTRLGGIVSD